MPHLPYACKQKKRLVFFHFTFKKHVIMFVRCASLLRHVRSIKALIVLFLLVGVLITDTKKPFFLLHGCGMTFFMFNESFVCCTFVRLCAGRCDVIKCLKLKSIVSFNLLPSIDWKREHEWGLSLWISRLRIND